MRERIARAANPQAYSPGTKRSDAAVASLQARALESADRVLAAMREPDRPMLQAMMRELGTDDHRPLGPMWRAAIDAATPAPTVTDGEL